MPHPGEAMNFNELTQNDKLFYLVLRRAPNALPASEVGAKLAEVGVGPTDAADALERLVDDGWIIRRSDNGNLYTNPQRRHEFRDERAETWITARLALERGMDITGMPARINDQGMTQYGNSNSNPHGSVGSVAAVGSAVISVIWLGEISNTYSRDEIDVKLIDYVGLDELNRMLDGEPTQPAPDDHSDPDDDTEDAPTDPDRCSDPDCQICNPGTSHRDEDGDCNDDDDVVSASESIPASAGRHVRYNGVEYLVIDLYIFEDESASILVLWRCGEPLLVVPVSSVTDDAETGWLGRLPNNIPTIRPGSSVQYAEALDSSGGCDENEIREALIGVFDTVEVELLDIDDSDFGIPYYIELPSGATRWVSYNSLHLANAVSNITPIAPPSAPVSAEATTETSEGVSSTEATVPTHNFSIPTLTVLAAIKNAPASIGIAAVIERTGLAPSVVPDYFVQLESAGLIRRNRRDRNVWFTEPSRRDEISRLIAVLTSPTTTTTTTQEQSHMTTAKILNAIKSAPHAITVAGIATVTGIDRTIIETTIDSLLRNGWLKRDSRGNGYYTNPDYRETIARFIEDNMAARPAASAPAPVAPAATAPAPPFTGLDAAKVLRSIMDSPNSVPMAYVSINTGLSIATVNDVTNHFISQGWLKENRERPGTYFTRRPHRDSIRAFIAANVNAPAPAATAPAERVPVATIGDRNKALVLNAIMSAPHSVSVSEICDDTDLDRSEVMRVMADLIDAEWIKEHADNTGHYFTRKPKRDEIRAFISTTLGTEHVPASPAVDTHAAPEQAGTIRLSDEDVDRIADAVCSQLIMRLADAMSQA